jgi:hypothetical protein
MCIDRPWICCSNKATCIATSTRERDSKGVETRVSRMLGSTANATSEKDNRSRQPVKANKPYLEKQVNACASTRTFVLWSTRNDPLMLT